MNWLDYVLPLVKESEGLHTVKKDGLVYPYFCPAGIPTIGWGHVVKSILHPPITKAQAALLLKEDLEKFYVGVIRLCPNLIGKEAKLAAIVDFAFNLGLGRLKQSTLRRAIQKEDWEWAAKELMKWTRGGGKVLPGLVRRRKLEVELLLKK